MSITLMCNGNVAPSRFVKQDTTVVSGYCLQAGTNDRTIGVSQAGTRQPPMPGLDDGFAGIQNVNPIVVFTTNDECWVEIASAVTNGDVLESDTNGRAVTSSADGHWYGAFALESGTALGNLILCRVIAPVMRGA